MKPTELRIGNLVYDNEGALAVLKSVSDLTERWSNEGEAKRVMYDVLVNGEADGYYECDYDELTPVKLTEDWLLKAGFKTEEGRVTWKLPIAYQDTNYPCTLQVSGSGIQICRSGIGAICPAVEHVHQLQNLYFALTGTELTFNP